MALTLTIRKARARDRTCGYDWQPYRVGSEMTKAPPLVVTVNGAPCLFMRDEATILWHNDGRATADLVRIARAYFRAMQALHYDQDDRRYADSLRAFNRSSAT